MTWTVLGQAPQVKILERSISSGRVSHAYLFSGPSGVGKRTLARNFIAALNCERQSGDGPCWECKSCLQVQSASHPDVHWVAPDGASVKIGQVRSLQKELSLHSYQGGFKVGVIEQAETMTIEAANSLLKTLEEPEGNTVLVLCTAMPQALLPTIISRCIDINLKRLPADLIYEALVQQGVSQQQARIIASISEGSLGWALEATQNDFMAYRTQLFQSLPGLKKSDTNRLLLFAEQMTADKDRMDQGLELLKTWFSDLLMGKIGDESHIINSDFQQQIVADCREYSVSDVISSIDAINETQSALRGYANQHLAMDVLLLRLGGRLRVTGSHS